MEGGKGVELGERVHQGEQGRWPGIGKRGLSSGDEATMANGASCCCVDSRQGSGRLGEVKQRNKCTMGKLSQRALGRRAGSGKDWAVAWRMSAFEYRR